METDNQMKKITERHTRISSINSETGKDKQKNGKQTIRQMDKPTSRQMDKPTSRQMDNSLSDK